MKLKTLDAIPENIVHVPTEDEIVEEVARLAMIADFNARMKGERIPRYHMINTLMHALAKRGMTKLYNRIVAHPAFQWALI